MALTSYQRRLKQIRYLRQACRESRALCAAIVGYAKKEGYAIKVPLAGRGVSGDDFITDTGAFSMWLLTTSAEALIAESAK